MNDDQILCAPEALASAAKQFSDKALQVLSIHSNLDSFSQTLHDSLPNLNARVSIDKFWSAWSGLLLNMANEIESIAILLSNAAVAYLESDKAIMQAFHADQAAQNTINSELKQIKDDLNTFDNKFNQEKQSYDNVNAQETNESNQYDKQVEEAKQQSWDNSVDWTSSDL